MSVTLERFAYSPFGTFGKLIYGDKTFLTVERPWLGNKPYKSCIPEGVYVGKMWKALKGGIWWLCWYGESARPDMCSINWRAILKV